MTRYVAGVLPGTLLVYNEPPRERSGTSHQIEADGTTTSVPYKGAWGWRSQRGISAPSFSVGRDGTLADYRYHDGRSVAREIPEGMLAELAELEASIVDAEARVKLLQSERQQLLELAVARGKKIDVRKL